MMPYLKNFPHAINIIYSYQGCGVDSHFNGVDFDSGVGIFSSTPTPTQTPADFGCF